MRRFAISGRCLFFHLALVCAISAPAQNNKQFDFGKFAVVILNESGTSISPAISLNGFVFDDDLVYNYSALNQIQQLADGDAAGYTLSHASASQSGDVDADYDNIQCGRYSIQFSQSATIRLNLLDGTFGAGPQSGVYKVLLEYLTNSSVNAYISTNPDFDIGAETAVFCGNFQGGEIAYWELVDAVDPGYLRERTGSNGKVFTIEAGDLPRYVVPSATLDLNCLITGDVVIPSANSVTIEGFQTYRTILKFDQDAGLTVNGALHTGLSTSSRTGFFPSTYLAGPSPGDWDGILFETHESCDINSVEISYAFTGMRFVDCYNPQCSNALVSHCATEGIAIENSSPRFYDTRVFDNTFDGIYVRGDQSSPWFCSTSSFSNGYNGICVDENAYAYIGNAELTSNGYSGVGVFGNSYVVIDSSRLSYNGMNGINTWANNAKWTTVQQSEICSNTLYGLYNVDFGYTRGYWAGLWATPSEIAVIDDSIGANCIKDNVIRNMYGMGYAVFELGRVYKTPVQPGSSDSIPHYIGGYNNIYYQNLSNAYQGHLEDNSEGFVQLDWWNGNYSWTYPGSTLEYTPWLMSPPVPACCGDSTESGMQGPAIASQRATDRSLDIWLRLAHDPAQLMLAMTNGIRTITPRQLAHASMLVSQRVDSAHAETFFRSLLSITNDPTQRRILQAHHAKSLLAQSRYADALNAYEAIITLTRNAPVGAYTAAQGMAALSEGYMGYRRSGLARLDTLLTRYPGDLQLVNAWALLRGGPHAGVPKAHASSRSIAGYDLKDAYPNPFNPMTNIRFDIPEDQTVRIVVTSSLGARVASLADGVFPAGSHAVTFDGTGLPSGTYFCTMTAGAFTRTITIALTK